MSKKEQILVLYRQGFGGISISRQLNLSPGTVYYHLRDVEKPNGGRQAKTSKDDIRRLYEEEKLSCQQIADKLCLSSSAVVYNRLKTMGVILRSKSEGMKLRGITKIGDELDIVTLYQSGLSQTDIAKKYDLHSGDSIRFILNRHNLNESNRGARNPSWKGGITTLANAIRSSSQYIAFRDKCFLEANYTSEISSIKSNNVNVHHIVKFAFLLNNFVDHDNWQKCPFLWNFNNVIVLSEEEHKQIHASHKLDIDFKKFSIKQITYQNCKPIIAAYHYIGTMPRSSKYIYGLFINDSLVGCCVFGRGANQYLSSGVGGEALELTRLCLVDWLPKNSGSFFLSRVIKQLKIDAPDIEFLISF